MCNKKLRSFNLVVLTMTGLALTSFAADYTDWVAKGYRWSLVNGPYAYNTKEDAKNELSRPSKKPVSEKVRHAYYLRPGKVVLVIGTDDAAGLSEIRIGGVVSNLWTATKNLSARPVKNAVGKIETPGMAGALPILTATPTADSGTKPARQ
jgi:hypothetical protein